ncbi:hypothetical protein Ddye_006708 [Dipteronia dyeriana]|uniref:SWIM-type domain-containing protein n=1 Tax=Dipteronia dyeriana TaxID=168575 RepID=A0AAE0CQT0_9ROSI|nr:hypothetical protein Ddye_006708 [Dipteronia dyeriana]
MDIFTITVMFGTEVVDVGQCDSDHISLISLIRATIEELNGQDVVPKEDCLVWIHLPWCDERVEVNKDCELIEFFKEFENRGLGKIVFELENRCYVPSPPEGSSSRPNEEPEVLEQQGGYRVLGWCDFEVDMLNYDGDSEKDDDKDGEDGEGEGEGGQANEGQNRQYDKVPLFEEESVDRDDGIMKECMDLFEGYQSKPENEYFSDSVLEPEHVRIAKLVKGIPFKKMVDGDIKFEVGQTFDNVEQMKELFREIYNNKEAKVKWIASKFENLVKGNPSISIKVISDLLREKYKVSVDIQRYCARHIYANFILTYNGDHFKKLFWRASRSSNVFDFKETMDEIDVINPAAKSWLQEIEPKHWSRYAYDHSRVLTIIAAENMKYELLGPNEGYAVKLGEYSCQCGCWQVSGIPCRHAMAVITHHCGKVAVKDKMSEYVHQCLTKSAYMQTYSGMIHPIPDQKRWPEVPAFVLIKGQTEHIDPPPRTVQPGRPKNQRKREPDEGPKGEKS